MFTQIGSVALFALAASESALGRPLLVQRQSSNSSIGNFGSCSVPEISFGVGFDNRKETSFEPTDQASYNHGSADNIAIITQFMCDNLVNSCKADATAQATCVTATNAAAAALPGTGGQADAFNAVFGIKTNFANIPVVSDQGTTLGVDGTNSVSGAAATSIDASVTTAAAAATSAAATEDCPAAVTVTVTGAAAAATSAAAESAATSSAVAAAASATGTAAAASSTDSASIGNFGSCTVPQIQFGVGFDNRKETAFEPVDQTSYNHGSADNIAVITQFMCNTLTNTCNADATAKETCATATSAAAAALSGTGQQADAFNAVFGIKTNFANVPVVSNTGVTLGVDGTNSATAATAATTSA
ncbi:hypothetical protein BDP27DRAFT_49891 [Rhodocollybia butyracea]|uniref:Uncharacterized protein n=1 Tax=Rhodocollybia butyracea TaxID=206335 RepID=A0A9P5PLX2_9AGAR|nr:hypothetical protein BDP27DRAFT_49891 [Rhodocollybia butyracea]